VVASSCLGQNSTIQLWHLKESLKSPKLLEVSCSHPPKVGYLQQAWRWFRFIFISIVVFIIFNVLLVFLVLQFFIVPYLIKVGDLLPNSTSLTLYKEVFSVVSVPFLKVSISKDTQ
jgi:hypothetical protein